MTSFIRCKFKACHSSVWIERLGLLVGAKYISIGANSDIQKGTYLTAWNCPNLNQKPEITIGSDCHIGAYNHITCVNRIVIEDGFVSGKWVTITDNSHGDSTYDDLAKPVPQREIKSKGPVIIRRNVWVGDKATILPGVTIGEGSIVGANAVVTKDIPAYCIVGGNPARVIRQVKTNSVNN